MKMHCLAATRARFSDPARPEPLRRKAEQLLARVPPDVKRRMLAALKIGVTHLHTMSEVTSLQAELKTFTEGRG